jgi:VanZ family protein
MNGDSPRSVVKVLIDPNAGRSPRLALRRAGLVTLSLSIVAAIVYLSLGPRLLEGYRAAEDHLPHVAAYAILTVSLLATFGSISHEGRRAMRVVLMGLAVLVLGASMEIAQGIVHRDAELRDLAADAVGLLVGLVAWYVAHAVRPGWSSKARIEGPGVSGP